jgi:hypothetical protein
MKVGVFAGNQAYLISQLESHLNSHSRLSVLVTYTVHTFRKLQSVVNVLRILMVNIHFKVSLNLWVETCFVAFVIIVSYGIGTFSACLYLFVFSSMSDPLFRKSLDLTECGRNSELIINKNNILVKVNDTNFCTSQFTMVLAICMGEDSSQYAGCAVHSYQTCVRLERAYMQIALDCSWQMPALGQCCQVCKLRAADLVAFYTWQSLFHTALPIDGLHLERGLPVDSIHSEICAESL